MKKIFFAEVAVLFILLTLAAFFRPVFIITGQKPTLFSPLPDFLNILDNKQVSTLNLWLPSLNAVDSKIPMPQISASSALVYDLTTHQTLFAKNPKAKLPMASLTKIMTAIIALENPKKDNQYLVEKDDLVGEDSMGLDAGEKLSLDELLHGLMLHSGNDTAETLASNFSGGRAAFVKAMNQKVESLGLKDTNFTNPTGLEGDGNQFTTAYDLLIETEFAINKFPLFDQVVSTFDYDIPQSSTHKEYVLENETNLLTSYPGVKGVKDGYTPEAGLCLVTFLDYKGHEIIGVILGSDDRRGEMIELLDYSLKTMGIAPPAHG